MCPDDYQLAAYIDQSLNHEDAVKVEKHLASCNNCLEAVFFLKKSLSKEPFFSENKKNILCLTLKNFGLEIKKKLGGFQAKSFELSFRNQNMKEKRIELKLGKQLFDVFHSDKQNFLVPKEDAELELVKESGRILFSGFCKAGQNIRLPQNERTILKTADDCLELEINNV